MRESYTQLMEMEKWANFLISAVRFNSARTHIDLVRVHFINEGSISKSLEERRIYLIDLLKKGVTFSTIIKNKFDAWEQGQLLHITEVNGTEFIKTVNNNQEVDNLDNLPEF